MKKIFVIFFLIFLAIVGCNNEAAYEVSIKPGVEKYSPLMSSVPGIPLTSEFKNENPPKKMIYQWSTEQGKFLSWQYSKVEELGKSVENNGDVIYWAVDFNEKEQAQPFKIKLKVLDSKTSKIIAESTIVVEKNAEGFYTVVQAINENVLK